MIAAAELALQRILTNAFVAADEQPIVLVRKTKVQNAAGGWTTTSTPLPAQNIRMNPLQDAVGQRTTADGKQVTPSYMLVCRHTADVERGDTFTIGGRRYEVVFVVENRQYQVKAEVAYLG